MNSTCGISPGGWDSVNVEQLAVPAGLPPAPPELGLPPVMTWKSCDDHSKWGAALPLGAAGGIPAQPWVCVCDNNREWSQEPRGGACTCMKSAPLWQAMSSVVVSSPDTCPSGGQSPSPSPMPSPTSAAAGGGSGWRRLLFRGLILLAGTALILLAGA